VFSRVLTQQVLSKRLTLEIRLAVQRYVTLIAVE
jgi:hypothetical protein